MKKNYDFSIGLRNINDAFFMKFHFLPHAVEEKKWNIVVSESHRIVELLLGGIILLLGGNPTQIKHNLDGVVQKFESILTESKGNIPFNIGYYIDDKNAFGLRVEDGSIRVYQKINSIYSMIASVNCKSEYFDTHLNADLQIEKWGGIILKLNDKVVIKHFCADLFKDSLLVQITRNLNIKPKSLRFLELKKMAQCFTHDLLLDARYSKREFSEEEAIEVKNNMERVFEISKNMVLIRN